MRKIRSACAGCPSLLEMKEAISCTIDMNSQWRLGNIQACTKVASTIKHLSTFGTFRFFFAFSPCNTYHIPQLPRCNSFNPYPNWYNVVRTMVRTLYNTYHNATRLTDRLPTWHHRVSVSGAYTPWGRFHLVKRTSTSTKGSRNIPV